MKKIEAVLAPWFYIHEGENWYLLNRETGEKKIPPTLKYVSGEIYGSALVGKWNYVRPPDKRLLESWERYADRADEYWKSTVKNTY